MSGPPAGCFSHISRKYRDGTFGHLARTLLLQA
jgi:hypothetical protein